VDDIRYSVLLASAFSLLLAFIDVPRQAKAGIRASLSAHFAFYLLILVLGNVIATVLASTVIAAKIPGPKFFWSAVLGVFGFQGVVKNVNVSVRDVGLLTIEEWISRAREMAVATAIRRQAVAEQVASMEIAGTIKGHGDLNAYVLHHLGPGAVASLEKVAKDNGADPALVKALSLASQKPVEAAALAKHK